MYYVDGQIKEEVYVFGSFAQSKMFKAGVNCLDCHDSDDYQQESHLNHTMSSEAAQCVSCHMPNKTYMGVDKRRDHSFKIPRPELSIIYNTPNACTSCHQNETDTWAQKQIEKVGVISQHYPKTN